MLISTYNFLISIYNPLASSTSSMYLRAEMLYRYEFIKKKHISFCETRLRVKTPLVKFIAAHITFIPLITSHSAPRNGYCMITLILFDIYFCICHSLAAMGTSVANF